MYIIFFCRTENDTLISGSRKINLVQFYQQKFNYMIMYPHLPFAKVSTAEKEYTLPIEVINVYKVFLFNFLIIKHLTNLLIDNELIK